MSVAADTSNLKNSLLPEEKLTKAHLRYVLKTRGGRDVQWRPRSCRHLYTETICRIADLEVVDLQRDCGGLVLYLLACRGQWRWVVHAVDVVVDDDGRGGLERVYVDQVSQFAWKAKEWRGAFVRWSAALALLLVSTRLWVERVVFAPLEALLPGCPSHGG